MSAYCTQCGVQMAAEAQFCTACGAKVVAPAAGGGMPSVAAAPPSLAWRIDVPVLRNRFLRGNIMTGAWVSALITGLLIRGIFAISGDLRTAAIAFFGAAALTLGLVLCGFIGYLIIVGFSQPIAYCLDSEGIRMENVSQAAKAVHWAALILGLLARQPSAAGAGLLAKASERRYCPWA
ncbi:MAG: zinc ribbon domain-containing protein, partial [Planctomycetota bacterium]|nr:zinc ribbon domain-containing protein [Planctomycetota bacterium]